MLTHGGQLCCRECVRLETCDLLPCLQVQAQQLGLSTLDAFSVSVKLAQEPLHAISAFVRLELMGANWTVTMPLLRRFLADQIKYTAQLVIQVGSWGQLQRHRYWGASCGTTTTGTTTTLPFAQRVACESQAMT